MEVMTHARRRRTPTPSRDHQRQPASKHDIKESDAQSASQINKDSTGTSPQTPAAGCPKTSAKVSMLNMLNGISQWWQHKYSFFSNWLPRKTNIAPEINDDVKTHLLAEKHRVDEIKTLMASNNYDAALGQLLSDTDKDLHYFNRIKGEFQGKRHLDSFSKKHGKLLHFDERPPPNIQHSICIWSGEDAMGNQLRCLNKCIYHPGEKIGVEQPKSLNFCVYHVKYCVNTAKHSIPMRIRTANNLALCNECFIQCKSCPPMTLGETPGTVSKSI